MPVTRNQRMPNVFVLDNMGGRTWSEMLPNVGEATYSSISQSVEWSANVTAGDVLVFHHQSGIKDSVASSAEQKGAWVVVVDFGGGSGLEQNGRLYHRKRSVKKPVDILFKACFAKFLERLARTGDPEWQLLEGPPAPDALLAYHLLGLLPDDPVAREERQRIRSEALSEGRVIAAERMEEFEEGILDDAGRLGEFLRETC